MKMKYKIKNITPKEMQCGIGLCPAIYEVTPKAMNCTGVAFCPRIYENKDESKYLIIGKIADAKAFGLEKKVGADECLIEVDKKLIDEKGK